MTVFSLSYSHSHIIVMLADDMACNARNPRPGESSFSYAVCVTFNKSNYDFSKKLHVGGAGSCDTPLVILFLTKDLNLYVSLTYVSRNLPRSPLQELVPQL